MQAMESVIKQSPLIRSTQGVEEHIENIQKVQSMGNLNCYRCKGNIYPKIFRLKIENVSFATRTDTLQKYIKRKKTLVLLKGIPT